MVSPLAVSLAETSGTQQGKSLVVLVPGMTQSTSEWISLKEKLQSEPGLGPQEANWLDYDHGAGLGAKDQASTLGLNLFAVIDQQWNKKPGGYQKVILIGRLTTLA